MKKRITVRYEGRVQGVGFRFTVVRLAQDLQVTGWVKNEFDGSVSMTAEGSEEQLASLLKAVQNSQLDRYIRDEQVRHSPAAGNSKHSACSTKTRPVHPPPQDLPRCEFSY